MATLIEKLWRCKSANGARQNNCPPTGPQLNTKKRGNLDLKERLREPEKKGVRERHPFCLDLDDGFPFIISRRWLGAKGGGRCGGGLGRGEEEGR